MTLRSVQIILELFQHLDFKKVGGIDDVQFSAFLAASTDLNPNQIQKVFDIFDIDRSGSCEFDEVLFCSFSFTCWSAF